MDKELQKKIIAYNKLAKERGEKASDLEILVGEIAKLPPGQLKKVLTQEAVDVLAKYGYTETEVEK